MGDAGIARSEEKGLRRRETERGPIIIEMTADSITKVSLAGLSATMHPNGPQTPAPATAPSKKRSSHGPESSSALSPIANGAVVAIANIESVAAAIAK